MRKKIDVTVARESVTLESLAFSVELYLTPSSLISYTGRNTPSSSVLQRYGAHKQPVCASMVVLASCAHYFVLGRAMLTV